MRVILCYDIANKKRLAKVAKLVSQYMLRLQHSVYYADLTEKQLNSLLTQLKGMINHRQDKVSLFKTLNLASAVLYNAPADIPHVYLYDEKGVDTLGAFSRKTIS